MYKGFTAIINEPTDSLTIAQRIQAREDAVKTLAASINSSGTTAKTSATLRRQETGEMFVYFNKSLSEKVAHMMAQRLIKASGVDCDYVLERG